MSITSRSRFSLITSVSRSSPATSTNKELIELSFNSNNNKPVILDSSEENYIEEEHKEDEDNKEPLPSLSRDRRLYSSSTVSSALRLAYSSGNNI
jgi:hypothetical protein